MALRLCVVRKLAFNEEKFVTWQVKNRSDTSCSSHTNGYENSVDIDIFGVVNVEIGLLANCDELPIQKIFLLQSLLRSRKTRIPRLLISVVLCCAYRRSSNCLRWVGISVFFSVCATHISTYRNIVTEAVRNNTYRKRKIFQEVKKQWSDVIVEMFYEQTWSRFSGINENLVLWIIFVGDKQRHRTVLSNHRSRINKVFRKYHNFYRITQRLLR